MGAEEGELEKETGRREGERKRRERSGERRKRRPGSERKGEKRVNGKKTMEIEE